MKLVVGEVHPIVCLQSTRQLRTTHPHLPFIPLHLFAQPACLVDVPVRLNVLPRLVEDAVGDIFGGVELGGYAEVDAIYREGLVIVLAYDDCCRWRRRGSRRWRGRCHRSALPTATQRHRDGAHRRALLRIRPAVGAGSAGGRTEECRKGADGAKCAVDRS